MVIFLRFPPQQIVGSRLSRLAEDLYVRDLDNVFSGVGRLSDHNLGHGVSDIGHVRIWVPTPRAARRSVQRAGVALAGIDSGDNGDRTSVFLVPEAAGLLFDAGDDQQLSDLRGGVV